MINRRQEGEFTVQAIFELASEVEEVDLLQRHHFSACTVLRFPHRRRRASAEPTRQRVLSDRPVISFHCILCVCVCVLSKLCVYSLALGNFVEGVPMLFGLFFPHIKQFSKSFRGKI